MPNGASFLLACLLSCLLADEANKYQIKTSNWQLGSDLQQQFSLSHVAMSYEYQQYQYPLIPAPWEIPIDFKVTKSIFPFSPRHLTLFNSAGSLAYRVIDAGPSSASRRLFTLFDASGATLLTLINEQDQWKAFRGAAPNGNGNGCKDHLIFTAKTLSASSRFSTVLDVFLPQTNVASFRLTGNPFGRYCTITKDDTIVAQTYLLYKLKKRIYSRRKFRLTVYPRNDHVLVLAMLTTFFGKS